ncbi:MAG: bifunctional pyr operon transcriptional regulator/uracil phosphoribosyltransferase PyrR [Candidatus Dormibacteria bacterium]
MTQPAAAERLFEGRPCLLDEMGIARAVLRMAHEVAEKHPGEAVVLAGIHTRGVPLAVRLARALSAVGHASAHVVQVDPRDHRDDGPRPVAPRPGAVLTLSGDLAPVTDRPVVLVDDVISTGRTLRAALDALVDAGRPRSVELLVLVDRGHRELPLRATYVGKNVPTAPSEHVAVRLREIDGVEGVWVLESDLS